MSIFNLNPKAYIMAMTQAVHKSNPLNLISSLSNITLTQNELTKPKPIYHSTLKPLEPKNPSPKITHTSLSSQVSLLLDSIS